MGFETENYFFSENIYLNRTKTLQRITFCAYAIVLTGDNTFVIRSQSSQSKKLNFLT